MLRRCLPFCLGTIAAGAFMLSAACSTSNGGGTGASGGSGGGPVAGPADMHCNGVTPQPTDQAVCDVTTLPDAGAGTGGGGGAGGGSGSDYGATMYGTEGDDDDCKYHVTWSSTPIAEHRNVTFTMKATYLTDGSPNPPECKGCPVTGANTITEIFLNDLHPAPNAPTVTTEGPKGTYTIGPIVFDAPGKWTVRFHLFENCADVLPNSPHGHAAFYVEVP